MNSIALPRFNPGLAFRQALATFLIATTFFGAGCSTIGFFNHAPSPTDVTTATALVVVATRDVVLIPPFGGVAQEATLNAFILAVHVGAQGLVKAVSTGQSILPAPADILAFLSGYAQKFGNPVWMQNFIGNLVTEYTRFYTVISKDVPTATAYLNAFIAGTV